MLWTLNTIRGFGIANQVNDLRGTPTFACICGCAMFRVTVMWDEETRAIGWYDLAQECIECGTVTTAPTEIDGCE